MASTEAVKRLVSGKLGRRVLSAERMTFGHDSVTYRVETDAGAVMVRTNDDPSTYRGTQANLDRLAELGLPVPRILFSDLSRREVDFAYLMTDVFPGRDLRFELTAMSRAQQARVAELVVGFERAATSLPKGRGFGFAPLNEPAPHRRWVDAVRADRGSIECDGDPELLGLLAQAYDLLALAEPRLAAIEPVCFLDDLTIKNVIVADGSLTGIVDFDVVCFGDPVYWLALTNVAITSDIGREGLFYVDELMRLWGLTGDDRQNFFLYSALHAAGFISHGDGDADWRPRMIRALRTSLAEARG